MVNFTKSQQAIIDSRNKNMIVSAAAGSGKTTVMIERIKDLILKDHVDISNFLIVTFTKASSEDMREKLVSKLTSEEPTPFLLEQLDKIGTADVSNLHSFCAKLLKTYFFEAGVDPTFVVLSDDEANMLKQKALNVLFDEIVESKDKSAYNLLDALQQNRSDEKIRNTILKLYEFLNVILDRDAWFKSSMDKIYNDDLNKNQAANIINGYVCARIQKILQQIAEKIEMCNKLHLTDLVAYLQEIESELNKIKSQNGFSKNAKLIFEIENFKVPPKVEPVFDEYKKNIDNFRKNINEELGNFKDNFVSGDSDKIKTELLKTKELVFELYKMTNSFIDIYTKLKKEKCGLDFNDLEQFTLKVLENSEILSALKQKYKYIFVDEYQDINSVQEKIIELLSGETNRFMVGDIKQSIYRFRLCDPDIFLEKYYSYDSDKKCEKFDLSDNFRSNKLILDFVNSIFNDRMTKDFGGIDYKETAQFVAGSKIEDETPVNLIYINTEDVKSSEDEHLPAVYSVKNHIQEDEEESLKNQAEINYIIAEIQNLVANKQIYDAKLEKYRPVRFKDIAILVPARENFVPDLVYSMEKNDIPASTDIKEDVLSNKYIKTLYSILNLVYNFKQDIELFNCMHSNLFGFTLDELTSIRLFAKDCRFFHQCVTKCAENNQFSAECRQKVDNFIKKINNFKQVAGYKTIKQLAAEIAAELDIENYMLCEVDGQSQISLLNKFLQSLPDQNLFEYFSDNKKLELLIEKTSKSNAVTILTIHKSKGLEFPITFVTNCSRQFNLRHLRADTIFSKDYGIGMEFYDTENRVKNNTIAKEAIKISETKNSVEEQQRLLYVALTRAINKLYVVAACDVSKIKEEFPERKNKFTDWFDPMVYKYLSGETIKNVDIKVLEAPDLLQEQKVDKNKEIVLNAETNMFSPIIKEALNFKYSDEKYTHISQKTSVTEIASGYHESEEVFEKQKGMFSSSSIDKGNAYHKLMQYIDFSANTQEKLNANIQELLRAGKISEQELKLVNLNNILNLLNNQEFIKVISSGKVLREKEFFMNMGTSDHIQIVQGVIDLAVVCSDGIIILDYKTGRFLEKSHLVQYSNQINLYADAAHRIYNQNVIKKGIVGVETTQIYWL